MPGFSKACVALVMACGALAVPASAANAATTRPQLVVPNVARPHGQPTAIDCTSSTSCMLVDQRGAALRYQAGSWSAPMSVHSPGLYAVSCTSMSFCMAVGDKGAAARWDGARWKKTSISGVSYL